MADILAQVMQVGFLAAIIRIACPLIFSTLGEMFCERAGVLNLGIEGIMLISAMTGFTAAFYSGSPYVGVAAAIATGAFFGALMGLLTVSFGVSQHVSGLGVTLLCTGLAFFFYRLIFGEPSTPPSVDTFERVAIPVLSRIPVIGPAVFNQFLLVYISLIAVPVSAYVLFRTPWGLSLRMVGENPYAADSAGVSVAAVRYQALIIGGSLMGIGGAFLTLAVFNAFTFGVISGRGWVCIALVVFGQWNPWRCAIGALLFALIDAFQLRLQAAGIGGVPYEVFLMLPFILTIAAMAFVSRNAVAPSALLKPFHREER